MIGQLLKIVGTPTVVSDTIDYIEAQFFFSSDWAGTSKVAHFKNGDTVYDITLNSDNQITADKHLNLSSGTWSVYVHGNVFGMRVTTSDIKLEVEQSGVLNGLPLPGIPLTTEEQMLADIETLKTSAEDGTLNGATFIPHIEAGENSFTISWTNDKGLTNPDPVTVYITV